MGDAFLKLKLKDQAKSMQLLSQDPELSQLRQLQVGAASSGSRCCKRLACLRFLTGSAAYKASSGTCMSSHAKVDAFTRAVPFCFYIPSNNTCCFFHQQHLVAVQTLLRRAA